MKIACLNCGANLRFIPERCILHCEHCNNEYNIDSVDVENHRYNGYVCNSCGAELMVDNNKVIIDCAYCGSKELVKKDIDDDFYPESIIPFKFSEEKAYDIFKKFLMTNGMSEEQIQKTIKTSDIKGVYVPSFLLTYRFEDYDISNRENENCNIYIYANYYFSAFYDASKKVSDSLIKGLRPIEFEKREKYNPIYTMGFYIENGFSHDRKIEKYIENNYLDEISYYYNKTNFRKIDNKTLNNLKDSRLVNIVTQNVEELLIPVYFIHKNSHSERATYAINGIDGKIVEKVKFVNRIEPHKVIAPIKKNAKKISSILMYILLSVLIGSLLLLESLDFFNAFITTFAIIVVAAILTSFWTLKLEKKRKKLKKCNIDTWFVKEEKLKREGVAKLYASNLPRYIGNLNEKNFQKNIGNLYKCTYYPKKVRYVNGVWARHIK